MSKEKKQDHKTIMNKMRMFIETVKPGTIFSPTPLAKSIGINPDTFGRYLDIQANMNDLLIKTHYAEDREKREYVTIGIEDNELKEMLKKVMKTNAEIKRQLAILINK